MQTTSMQADGSAERYLMVGKAGTDGRGGGGQGGRKGRRKSRMEKEERRLSSYSAYPHWCTLVAKIKIAERVGRLWDGMAGITVNRPAAPERPAPEPPRPEAPASGASINPLSISLRQATQAVTAPGAAASTGGCAMEFLAAGARYLSSDDRRR